MTTSVQVPATRTGTVRKHLRMLTALLATIVGIAAITVLGAAPAAANTKSDYSKTFYVGGVPGHQGQPLTVGWTNGHAWVIANWAAALAAGAGEIADELCSAVGGEGDPFNPVGHACDSAVSDLVAQLTAGQPSLTNHGLWIAYYAWNGPRTVSGTW